jgi:hypothetical protein
MGPPIVWSLDLGQSDFRDRAPNALERRRLCAKKYRHQRTHD